MDDNTFDNSLSEKAGSFIKEYFGSEFWSGFEKQKQKQTKKPDYPKVDLFERESEVVVIVELPGLRSPGDVEVIVNNTSLLLKGTLFCPSQQGANCLQNEFADGSFRKEITLPAPIDANSVTANYRRGVLEVRMERKTLPTSLEFDFE